MDENSVELPCEATRKVLAVFGALPCTLHPPYWPSLNPMKSTFIYCIIVYSIISYDVAVAAMISKHQYDETNPSDLLGAVCLEHILAMFPFILGIYFWIDVQSLIRTLKHFQDLQVKFRMATGKPLENRRKREEKRVLLAAIGMFFVAFLVAVLLLGVDPTVIIGSLYANTLAICVTLLWLGLSGRIYDAAEDTKAEFICQLDSLTPSAVYNFRLVWLSMRSYLDSMGKLRIPSMLYSLCMCAVVILFYEGAILFQNELVVPAVCHVIAGTFYVGLISVVCNTTHRVQDEMKGLVGEVLSKVALTSYDIKIQREIVMLYLIESARPAVTNILGFLLVNKKLILSFFSNISTYIIVLVQFSQNGSGFGM